MIYRHTPCFSFFDFEIAVAVAFDVDMKFAWDAAVCAGQKMD
jgi:hypothetical protein